MSVLCLLLVLICGNAAESAPDLHPLAPPDTSSPRATLNTFLNEMNKAVGAYKAGERDQARVFLNRAESCLNLDTEPQAIKSMLGVYSALYLKETLDRIYVPPPEEIPDTKTDESQKLTGWTLPYTEITIAAVKDGPMGPRFLFSPETVARAEEFYNKVLSLPYKPGAEGALVDQLSSSAGLIATKKIMDRLPVWLKVEIVGEAVWQWIGLILYLLFTVAALLITYRYVRKGLNLLDTRLHSNFTYSLGGLVLPIILMLFPEPALRFLVYCLHLRNADLYLTIAFVCLLISYAGRIWLYAAVLNRAAAAVIAMAKLEPSGMHAQTIRLAFDVSTVVIVIASTINLGSRLGLPTYSLVTGLGVGGLAVALAAREALSNLIGTIAIFLDRPFKLGDFIVLGDANQGTVAEIGLRSTCIKRMDGVLVSIPNANITKANIINESAPEAEIRISLPIGVAYGSSVNEVEQALLTASKRCDYVSAETAPSVRLVTYGDSAVQFEVLVWIIGPECRGQAKDQINRAIGEEFEKRGIEMPFPQRDVHIHAHK